MIPAIFFSSAAILAFELICAQLIGFILGNGYSLVVISIAMLGMSFAASLLSALPLKLVVDESKRLAWLTLALALSILVVFVSLFMLKETNNEQLVRVLASATSMRDLHKFSTQTSILFSLVVGTLMAVPYLLFGFILTLALQCTAKERIAKLYGFDLLGAASGGMAAYLLMEQGSFTTMVVLPIGLCLAGMICFLRDLNLSPKKIGLVSSVSLLSLLVIFSQAGRFEPRAELHSVARDVRAQAKVTDVWHGWSSYSRVGLLHIQDQGQDVHNVVIGNGSGHATLAGYPLKQNASQMYQFATVALMTALGIPQRALILLAGTGAEMEVLDDLTKSKTYIKGVELNPRVREAALYCPELKMAEFYAKKNCNYVIDEARSNLEQDKSKYDVILYSWSGATYAYYTGNMGATVQYVYTKEALQSALNHLTPQGYLIVLNTKKSRFVAMLKSILGPQDISNTVMLIEDPYPQAGHGKFGDEGSDAVWDNDILLIKPSGFSAPEIATLTERIKQLNLTIRYCPGTAGDSEQALLTGLLKTNDLDNFILQYNKTATTPLFIADDDRPFILLRSFLRTDFGSARRELDSVLKWLTPKQARLDKCLFALAISFIAFLLIMGPPLVASRVANKLRPSIMLYFACLGAGFMFVEVGLINQLNLLVGSPGLALAIVLSGLISSSGAGSLFASNRLGQKAITAAAAALVLYLALIYLFGGSLIHLGLSWPIGARIFLTLMLTLPPGFLMGLFLPRGLAFCAEDNPRMLPLAWAINGAVGTSAAAWSWALSENLGFRCLILIGAIFYLGIFALLLRRQLHGKPISPEPAE